MKKLAIIILVATLTSNICFSQKEKEIKIISNEIHKISDSQKSISSEFTKIKKDNYIQNEKIKQLQIKESNFATKLDSINNNIQDLAKIQETNNISLKNDIQKTNTNVATNLLKINSRTIWGVILLIVTIITFSTYIFIKKRKYNTSINEVRKAQDALQSAQKKIQEDSVKLDNQMLILIEKQMNTVSTAKSAETDHSLAIKVADEIVRIELNLSRMDPSIKGYKQLSKAVERIKDNFQANGYEIIDLLGKPYNDGMKVVANFVADETLKEGEQIITGITKPQINYNGKMIQSAQITVSQNI